MQDVHITVGLCVDQISPAVNYAFPQKIQLSLFAGMLCAAHIHIRCQYRTSDCFLKPSQFHKIVLKRVEENAKKMP